MRVMSQDFEIVNLQDYKTILNVIEKAGRVCYKSEDKITEKSAESFIKGIINSGHVSVIEHFNITVKFITERGVSHELVRHRLASYSQESTRYCNFSKDKFRNEIAVIPPIEFTTPKGIDLYTIWSRACKQAEEAYMELIAAGASPQQARSVLPTCLKTEIFVTCNIREWRHIFNLRCSKKAHPQIRELLFPLLKNFAATMPVLFSDIYENLVDTWGQ